MSLTAIPNRSESGSVPITISALILSANSNAIFNAAGSSGLGDFTVGKFPSGLRCSSTMVTSVNPACFKAAGIAITDVPCSGVKTIFNLFLLGVLKVPFLTHASIKTLSISVPTYCKSVSLASNFILLKSTL